MKMDDKTDFEAINKLLVSIASHKVQLAKCTNIDEIDEISRNIWKLENDILMERKKELKTLNSRKEDLLQKMAALESSLDDVNRKINARLMGYRDAVTSRITLFESEVNGKKGEMETPTIE